MTETRRRDIQFGVTLAGIGLALLPQVVSHPWFAIAAVLLAIMSSYLVMKHL